MVPAADVQPEPVASPPIEAATRVRHVETGELGTCKGVTEGPFAQANVEWDNDSAKLPPLLPMPALEWVEG